MATRKVFLTVVCTAVGSLLLSSAAMAAANSPASATMEFSGALTDAGGGVYTGTIAGTAGSYYVVGGPGAGISILGGFDVYAQTAGCCLVEGYYGTGAWNCPGGDTYVVGYYVASPNDGYPTPGGPWGSFYDPDVADYYHYELTLTATNWYLRYNGTVLGAGNGTPMSGAMDWTAMYASEDDVGAYLVPPADPDANDGGCATHGAGAGWWDMDWTWGSDCIPLEFRGFNVSVTPIGKTGDYDVTLTPSAHCGNGVLEAGEECDDGDTNDNNDCTNACEDAECGDGIVWNQGSGTEECDDAGESGTCDVDCTWAVCGDLTVNTTAGEECDDGADGDDTNYCLDDCTRNPKIIPTVSEWGLIVMALLAFVVGTVLYGRRRRLANS